MRRKRTFVYVDGFNLYYRALKDTDCKWLDLKTLLQKILGREHDILKVKYFTARASGRANDRSLPQRQRAYLRALEAFVPEVDIYHGFFSRHDVLMPRSGPVNEAGERDMVRVIKTEEKGSDVNLAVHFLNDAWRDSYDCAVLVSSDQDFAEAMRVVRREFPDKFVGLITPRRGQGSKNLRKHANFHRVIERKFLESSQLPSPIPGTNLHSPWSPRPPTP